MTSKKNFGQRLMSVFLVFAVLMTMLPLSVMAASASSDHISRASDPSTMDTWRDFFLPDAKISTENAGGVWMDKSVFTDDREFSFSGITMDNSDAFLVALSAMATNMTVIGMSHVPTDTMLILDVSGSMNDNSDNNDVAEELVEAANESIASLLEINKFNRVGVVLYSGPTTQGGATTANDAVLILPLGRYETGRNGQYLTYNVTGSDNNTTETVSLSSNVVYEGTDDAPFRTRPSKTVVGGTYIQKGVMLAANQLIAEDNETTVIDTALGTIQRKPVMVLMSDGAPTVSSTNFQNPTSINLGDGTETSAAQGFVNQLTASYAKGLVETKYNTDALFYTIGLGVSNDAVAVSVLDPNNRGASIAINNFWSTWNTTAVGNTVTVQSRNGNLPTRTVTKINGLDKNYVDEYINVENNNSNISLGDRLKEAFADIVGKINLQSQYTPTLITQVGDDHSGFISFVDKIGEYMQVTDIKGILINDTLYSGADLASNFVSGGGNLGTYDNPTALGHEMVAAVRERIGLANDDEARTLIGLAYEYGQIRYNGANNYSNYIGWYADEDSNFLGFYQDGVTNITDPDAVYTIKSYGYLGVEHDSNMMYATVQVRHNIKTGEETVAFAVPASLIPVMTYNVTLDGDGELSNIELSGAESPIRLVYEVALDENINEWNVKDVVSAEYLADEHNINEDGSINFYTNNWEHTNETGYNTVNTYSYFNPSRQNDKYYYTEDAPVYTDAKGTLYSGATAPDANGTFYRAYTVYEENGAAHTKRTVYRQLSSAALETAKQREGTNNWYIPNGNVHVNLDGYTISKDPNVTDTLSVANQPFVDVYGHNVNDTNHTFYVGATLGNNGKLTLEPQTGIKLSKAVANGSAATEEAFEFVITKAKASESTHDALLVNADGREIVTRVSFNRSGVATVNIKAGQILYIGDMTAGDVISISETETAGYIPFVTVSGAESSNPASVTVADNQLIDVAFVNADRGTGNLTIAKEVEHDFGVDYQIPADKLFTVQVTLNGIGTADAKFTAKHTNGKYTEISTDENGQFTIELAHGEQFEVFGLPTGTVVTVVETKSGTGFTPAYWDNGVIGDGQVTVVRNSTVSVIVVNDYEATEVYPVNLDLGGEKIVKNADNEIVSDWDADWEFTIVLERYGANGWDEVDRKTVNAQNKAFSFDMSNEVYAASGVYSYQLYEIEPDIDAADRIDGMIYDLVWHTFSVYVSDADMDGQLEIVRVHSDHANKDFELVGGRYNIKADFENVQTVTIPALATVDIQKALTNESGSPLVSLAGYNFGLYTDAECTTVATVGNGIQNISLNPTDAVGEGWIDIQFNETGEYTFYVKEIVGNINKMSYSTNVIKVVVDVSIHSQNSTALVADVSYFNADGSEYVPNSAGEIVFTNIYNPANAELPINFVSKEISGRTINSGDNFTFEVQLPDGTTVLTGSNNGTETVTFNGNLRFSKVGTYFYNIVETSADGNGITVDKTTYRVTVNVTDVNGQLVANYTTVNAVGSNIVFRNTYEAAETTYAISGKKELNGRVLINDEFTFVLTEALNADGDIAEGAKTYEAHNEFGGQFTFPEITYTEAGTYYYVVSEKQNSGSNYGIVYDTTKYVVTVTVRDDIEKGELVATANLETADIKFKNEYVAKPVSKSIDGEKVLNGKTLVGGQFSFELWQSNAEWGYVNAEPIQTVANDNDGNFAFGFVDYTNSNATDFTKVGTYYYLIKEVNGGATIKGITYDNTVYRVRVEITDDLLGQLHATVHIYDNAGVPQQSIVFRNNYEITGDSNITIRGTKILNGDRTTVEANEFEFGLYDAAGELIEAVKNDADGNFAFSTLKFDETDVPVSGQKQITYTVREIAGNNARYTYDDTIYTVVVTVKDNDSGGIEVTYTVNDTANGKINFTNTYTNPTPVTYTPMAKKNYNKTLNGGEFKFKLEGEIDGTKISQEKTNSAGGSITFDTLSFPEAGTYTFTVKEIEKILGFIRYSTAEYELIVNIIDTNGVLSLGSVTVNNDPDGTIEFTNTYVMDGEDEVTVRGTKILNGDRTTVEANEFEFGLYDAAGELIEAVKNDADGNFAFSTLKFDETDVPVSGQKQITYTVREIAGSNIRVTYDQTVYTVVVTVEDNEQGGVSASYTVDSDANGSIAFNNIYTPKPEDINVDFDIIKTVVNKGSEKIGPEGFEFLLNALADGVADITVKADENGKARFTLTFTEDDIGNTYTYKLTEVNGGKANVTYSTVEHTVTVAISLNQDNELVATLTKNGENTATVVAEFENVYDYTPTPEYPKSPQTGDNTNLHLWFALLFVSGGGIFGTTLYGRKKKDDV